MFGRPYMRLRAILLWTLLGTVAGLSGWLGQLSAKHQLPWQHANPYEPSRPR